MTRIAIASGSVAAIVAPWSAKSAADPPTSTGTGAGKARTAVTACCPAAEIGSAGLASVISQVPGARATGPLAWAIPGSYPGASRPA